VRGSYGVKVFMSMASHLLGTAVRPTLVVVGQQVVFLCAGYFYTFLFKQLTVSEAYASMTLYGLV